MDENLTFEILENIKASKKYSGLSDEVIVNEINSYFKKNKISKISKQDIKEIKNILHKSYSSFQTRKKNKVRFYLEELKKYPLKNEITNSLLSITLSTKERLEDYAYIYKKIFEITGVPKTIVDIGAGLNIFSYPKMNLPSLNYYSYDINEEDKLIINEYIGIMKKEGLNGKAEILDTRNVKAVLDIPKSDVIFMFKLLDLLDRESHKPSEELITTLFKNNKSYFIVVSFATRTLTRKKMNHPGRLWFELMLKRNNLNFQTIKTDNEIFYILFRDSKSL